MARSSFFDRVDGGDDELVITIRGTKEKLEALTEAIHRACQSVKADPEKQRPPCRGCGKD